MNALLRNVVVLCASVATTLTVPASASANEFVNYEQCEFDATTGTLTVTPQVWHNERFEALDEAWDGSFTCGIHEDEKVIQLASLAQVVVTVKTPQSSVRVPAWLSERAGREIDVTINPTAGVGAQRVIVSVSIDPDRPDAVGKQVSVRVGTTHVDVDGDGDAEVTVTGDLPWILSLGAFKSWGTFDLRAYVAPKDTKPGVFAWGPRPSTIYAPRSGRATISTGDAADVIHGGWGPDNVESSGGNDTIHGNGGNDVIDAGKGADRVFGGTGRDQLEGGHGRDRLDAGPGDDYVFPDEMRDYDRVVGGNDDKVFLGGGINMVINDGGDDVIVGGPLTDFIRVTGGKHTVHAGDGRDVIDVGSWEPGTVIDCEGGIDWRRYPAGYRFPPQLRCERYTRKDPRRMPWKAVGIGVGWVT